MNINLHAAIKKRYPDAKFQLRDDSNGKGVYLELWEDDAPQPNLKDAALLEEALTAGDHLVKALDAKHVLRGTDWKVLRALEMGTSIPQEVVAARAQARADLAAAKLAGYGDNSE